MCLQGSRLFILKLGTRGGESERRLILFLSISKCLGACGEVKQLERGERRARKVRRLPSSPVTGTLGFYLMKLFLSLGALV